MSYLLDTNVLAEPGKPRPDPRVVDWLRSQASLDLSISVLTLGEIQKGIALLPDGAKRRQLERWLVGDLTRQFSGRVLPVNQEVAIAWGELTGEARRLGRELPSTDGLLLATAFVHDLTFATRNERDCQGLGVQVYNPWS